MTTSSSIFPTDAVFAAATMVTLGFGNINTASGSLLGMFVVVINLMTGYFLLAVLVTRLAVLSQTMAPGYDVPPKQARPKAIPKKKAEKPNL